MISEIFCLFLIILTFPLFNIISDKLDSTNGSVRLGETVNLSYVDQSRETLDPIKTVWEEISEGNDVVEINSTTINTRAYTSAFNFKTLAKIKKSFTGQFLKKVL